MFLAFLEKKYKLPEMESLNLKGILPVRLQLRGRLDLLGKGGVILLQSDLYCSASCPPRYGFLEGRGKWLRPRRLGTVLPCYEPGHFFALLGGRPFLIFRRWPVLVRSVALADLRNTALFGGVRSLRPNVKA